MSQFVETPCKTFTAGAALSQYRRVKTPSSLAYAGAADIELGVLEADTFASGDEVSVRLRTAPGTRKMVAAGAVSADAVAYAAANGKVDDTGTLRVGVFLQAATADGDIVEVLPDGQLASVSTTVTIEHHTADDTLTTAESGSVHTNLGAAGAITFTLPQDATAGVFFRFNAMAAQELRVDPGSAGAIYINGAKQTDNKYISFDDEGECVVLTCDGNGDWIAGPSNGTFTVEG